MKVELINESLNDLYRSHAKHPVLASFTISDIETAVNNGWLNRKPADGDGVSIALNFSMPEEARGKISGYVGDRTLQILANSILGDHLCKGEFRIIYASNTNNIGLTIKVNGQWILFYKQKYDFGKGIMSNIVSITDNAIDAYAGKDLRFECMKALQQKQ